MMISIQPLSKHHVTLLLDWLSNDALLEFYAGRDKHYTLEAIAEDFYPDEDNEYRFIAYIDNMPIGYVQYYELDAESYEAYGFSDEKVYGMDQFIGDPKLWNKGIGTLLVNVIVNNIISEHHPDKIVMDPQVRNKRSIRCYEKCGFSIIKLLPNQEWHEGKLEDCYLMAYRK